MVGRKLTDTRRPVGLGVAIERVAAEHPAGIALIQDERAFTYATLNGWANRIADYLASLGLEKGDTVAVNLKNRPELLATVIGSALGLCTGYFRGFVDDVVSRLMEAVMAIPGVILALGSIAGASLSVHFALKVGQNTLKWILFIMVSATCAGAFFL